MPVKQDITKMSVEALAAYVEAVREKNRVIHTYIYVYLHLEVVREVPHALGAGAYREQ
jgi:hypothetical protein